MPSEIIADSGETYRVKMLLPYYFKKIGLAIFLICLFQSVFYAWLKPDFMTKDFSFLVKQYGSLLGIFLFAWAQYKMETQETVLVKIKALAFSVIFCVLYFFVSPLIDLIFMDSIEEIKASSLLFNLLFFFLVIEWMGRPSKR
jgi:hypothetical protein